MRRHMAAAAVIAGLSALVALIAVVLPKYADGAFVSPLAWAFIPGALATGAPIAAWYGLASDVDLPGDGSVWVQLRVCGAESPCALGARKPLAPGSSGGIVTTTQSLTAGSYEVELLVVRVDRLGAARTILMASQTVAYGQ